MSPSKTLIIVESPAKAHTIQAFLNNNYIVMASQGHITELAKGNQYGLGVDVNNKFKPYYILSSDKVNILSALLEAGEKCDNILLACDDDREGTAICWHLSQKLKGLNKPMQRIVFNEIKKSKVLKAIQNPADINMNIVHAQEARRILDRVVGFTASPFLLNFMGPKLSAGRVQSVVTRMVIDRERAIEKFKSTDYWGIQVSLTKDNKESFIAKYAGKLLSQETADKIKNILENNKEFVVSEVLAEEEVKHPNPPLVTSSLQRLMSKKYDFNAERTMRAAQSLYEAGHCTYIRTDSLRAGDDAIAEVRQWIETKFDLPKKANVFKNKNSAQDAHECIRPSNLSLTPESNLLNNPDEKLVYENIWKYFISSQMKPALYDTLKIVAYVKNNNKIEVKTSGKALKYKGFLEMLGIEDNSKIEIPHLQKNDLVSHFGENPVQMEKKQTQPPPRYSEDKLIKELEDKNIGRPATYAELLNKITLRNYVEKKGNIYHATDIGKKVTDELNKYFTFMDFNYTALMEKSLDEIENGNMNYLDMLNDFFQAFKKELGAAYSSHGGKLCPVCQFPIYERTSMAGVPYSHCASKPFCKPKFN